MGRFAARVLAYTIGATILWWLTRSATAAWTIEGAKLLHRLVGAPAPFLILEMLDYWWLAPPVQLFVGLTLAASWLTWRRRLLALVVGVYLLWLIVMMDVVSMSSPYLGPSSMRTVISSILTNGHLIVAPIIFWLILVGIPPARVIQAWRGETARRPDDPPGPSPGWWPRTFVAFMVCSAVSVVVYAPALTAAPEVKQARRALSVALRAHDDRRSILHALELRKIERKLTKREDPSLYYLLGRLAERYGNRELADKCLFHPAIDPRVQAAIRKQQRTRPTRSRRESSPILMKESDTPSASPLQGGIEGGSSQNRNSIYADEAKPTSTTFTKTGSVRGVPSAHIGNRYGSSLGGTAVSAVDTRIKLYQYPRTHPLPQAANPLRYPTHGA